MKKALKYVWALATVSFLWSCSGSAGGTTDLRVDSSLSEADHLKVERRLLDEISPNIVDATSEKPPLEEAHVPTLEATALHALAGYIRNPQNSNHLFDLSLRLHALAERKSNDEKRAIYRLCIALDDVVSEKGDKLVKGVMRDDTEKLKGLLDGLPEEKPKAGKLRPPARQGKGRAK